MKNYKFLANECRKTVLRMIHKAQTSHIASNFSCIDIATVLYENLKEGDEVVWSKGWVAATIYYFLAKQGKIPYEDLDKFGKEIVGEIPYLGLAETSTPGVHVSGGSMGHGLPVAVGMALAKKRAGEKGKIYCIMSDGELNEGTTWESAMLAAHHKLDNLVVFVDRNGWQAMGKTEDVLKFDARELFKGFGWNNFVINGHYYNEIEYQINREYVCSVCRGEKEIHHTGAFPGQHSVSKCYDCNGTGKKKSMIWKMPTAVICDTIKGKGVSLFEDKILFHYKHIDKETYELALKELENA